MKYRGLCPDKETIYFRAVVILRLFRHPSFPPASSLVAVSATIAFNCGAHKNITTRSLLMVPFALPSSAYIRLGLICVEVSLPNSKATEKAVTGTSGTFCPIRACDTLRSAPGVLAAHIVLHA